MAPKNACAVLAAALMTVGTASLGASRPQDQTKPPAPPQTVAPSHHDTEVTKTFTIEAINRQTRAITLKDKAGNEETVIAGPKVTRFDALKVGDTVTFQYFESVLYSIQPAGASTSTSTKSTTVREEGNKPGGTTLQTQTATVVITAIDATVPSVTVRSDAGNTMSFKVKDPQRLTKLNVGDRVDITYQQALAVSVK